jgi:hypothetical protein
VSKPLAILLYLAAALVGLCHPAEVFAASDQVLRAAYCAKVLDGMIAFEQSAVPPATQQALDYYRSLSKQRRLTPAEQQNYADLQKLHSVDEPRFRRGLQDIRARLGAYLVMNSKILPGALSSGDNRALNDALVDAAAIGVAMKRGETDYQRCQAEMSIGSAAFCLQACAQECSTDPGCGPRCSTRCGTPTCVRPLPCINPTFLPY